MKPYPFSALNHLTVPFAMRCSHVAVCGSARACRLYRAPGSCADATPRAARRHTGFERPIPDTNEVTRGHKGLGATNDRGMATIPHGSEEPLLGGQPATLSA